jgi:Altronate dehydratase
VVNRVEAEAMALGLDIRGTQPSPGNIRGGLTTIEEKSLGATHKAGERTRLEEVVPYASRVSKPGLTVMDTPGLDVESVTGMVGGGAQVVVFTTGLGTPTGNPVAPVIKITGNARTAQGMADNIDVDVSGVMSEEKRSTPPPTGCSTKCSMWHRGGRPRRSGSAIASSRFIAGTRRYRGAGLGASYRTERGQLAPSPQPRQRLSQRLGTRNRIRDRLWRCRTCAPNNRSRLRPGASARSGG